MAKKTSSTSNPDLLLTISFPQDQAELKVDMQGRALQAELSIPSLIRKAWTVMEESGWAACPEVAVVLKRKGLLNQDGTLVHDIRSRTLKTIADAKKKKAVTKG
jgi:hypothetical protein